MNKKLLSGLVSASLLSAAMAAPAFAHQAGDFIVKAGAAMVAPNESSEKVSTANNLGEFKIDSDTQLGLNFTYMYTDNIAVELVAASPFTHEVELEGFSGELAEVTQLPPTLLAEYYFGNAQSKLRPYVGVGVNYTIFFDEDFKTSALGLDNLEASSSVGFAAKVGVDYMISEKWLVNASVMYADINTDIEFDSVLGHSKIDTDIDPFVYMVSLGYVF